jgi:hypothetical protein
MQEPSIEETIKSLPQLDTVRLKNGSCLCVRGAGAEKLLQGQLTCDVARLTPLQPQLGAYCNLQGKVVVSFYLLKRWFDQHWEYWLVLPDDLQQITLDTLKKYAVFFEVTIEARDLRVIGLTGEDTLPLSTEADILTLPLPLTQAQDATRRLWITASGEVGSDDDRRWRCADIQQGIVHVDAALSEQYLPNLLNYPVIGAVDFKKGCYRGQEIVARVYYRGQLKQRLARLTAHVPGTEAVQTVTYEEQSFDVLSQVNLSGDWYALALLPADLPSSAPLMWGAERLPIRQWVFA